MAFSLLMLPCSAFLGKVISEEYELEYGTDCLEMHVGAVQPGERALVIDDLVATGGTLSAAIRLLGEWRFMHLDVAFPALNVDDLEINACINCFP